MVDIFSQADESFLFGLAIPFDDRLILGARVDMLWGHFEGSDAEGMSFVLYGFSKSALLIMLSEILVQFMVFPHLIYGGITYYSVSC